MELYIRRAVQQDGLEIPDNLHVEALVWGPGMLLFNLVIIRLYLRRPSEDDDEIYRIVVGATKEANRLEKERRERRNAAIAAPTDSGEDEVSKSDTEEPISPRYRVIRQLTTTEQAVAARLGRRHTTLNVNEDPKYYVPVEPRKNMVKRSLDFEIEANEPQAIVWTRPDIAPHVWPISNSKGMTGGAIYVPYSVAFGRASTANKPKPRPRAVKRKRAEDETIDSTGGEVDEIKRLRQ